jgi:hypothetical protein
MHCRQGRLFRAGDVKGMRHKEDLRLVNPYVPLMFRFVMTIESTGSDAETFDADAHDQETKKAYYHKFDDDAIDGMKKYFKVEDSQDVFLRYLKNRRVPGTTPNDV